MEVFLLSFSLYDKNIWQFSPKTKRKSDNQMHTTFVIQILNLKSNPPKLQ